MTGAGPSYREAVGSDSAQVVRVGDGSWVTGGSHTDTSCEVIRGSTVLGSHGPRQGTAYIQDGISDRQGTAELSH